MSLCQTRFHGPKREALGPMGQCAGCSMLDNAPHKLCDACYEFSTGKVRMPLHPEMPPKKEKKVYKTDITQAQRRARFARWGTKQRETFADSLCDPDTPHRAAFACGLAVKWNLKWLAWVALDAFAYVSQECLETEAKRLNGLKDTELEELVS